MKETTQASGAPYLGEPGARAAMHEMMAAFEAFKGANDARLDEIEKKASADAPLAIIGADWLGEQAFTIDYGAQAVWQRRSSSVRSAER